MRLLLVEDDPQLGDGLAVGLRQSGYTVDWTTDGRSAACALQDAKYDLILLDLGLPRLSGSELLTQLRQRGDSTPTIILTARSGLDDKVAGLDSGADEYLIKPIVLQELTARIRALLRRTRGRATSNISVNNISLDPASHVVLREGVPIELTQREFALLQLFMENAGRALTRSTIVDTLYGWDDAPGSNALEVHIHNLRVKLGEDAIRTLRGIGYIMQTRE